MSKEIAQTVGGKKIAYLIAILAFFAIMATLGSRWKASEAAEVPDQAPLVLDVSVDAAIPGGGNLLTGGATAEVASAGDILTDALESARVSLDETTHRDDTGGTASFAQLEGIAFESAAFDNGKAAIIVNESGIASVSADLADDASYPNGQTVQTVADMNEPVGAYDVPNNDHASSFWDQSLDGAIDGLFDQTNSILAERSTSTNSWDIGVPNSSPSGWDLFREHSGSGEVIASSSLEGVGPSEDTVSAFSSEDGQKVEEGGVYFGLLGLWVAVNLLLLIRLAYRK